MSYPDYAERTFFLRVTGDEVSITAFFFNIFDFFGILSELFFKNIFDFFEIFSEFFFEIFLTF